MPIPRRQVGNGSVQQALDPVREEVNRLRSTVDAVRSSYLVGPFSRSNMAATTSGVLELAAFTNFDVNGIPAWKSGRIVAVSLLLSTTPTAGTAKFEVTVDGTSVANEEIGAGDTRWVESFSTSARALAFDMGSELAMAYSTSGLAPAGSMDVAGWVVVEL